MYLGLSACASHPQCVYYHPHWVKFTSISALPEISAGDLNPQCVYLHTHWVKCTLSWSLPELSADALDISADGLIRTDNLTVFRVLTECSVRVPFIRTACAIIRTGFLTGFGVLPD